MAALARRLDTPVGAEAASAILSVLTSPLTYYQFRAGAGARSAARRVEHTTMSAIGLLPARP
jgi:hypothetical protein